MGFDILPTRQRSVQTRVSQRGIVPGAVKSRHLDNVIFGTTEETVQTTLANNEQVTINYSITQNDGFEEKADLYFVIYIGSVAAANKLPGGSAIDESQWQVIGPFFDYDKWTEAGFSKHQDFVCLYIRNISAGSSIVIVQSKFKYFSVREGGST